MKPQINEADLSNPELFERKVSDCVKVMQVNSEWIDKYLTSEAKIVMNHPIFNTVNEIMEVDETYQSGYRRDAYFIQYLTVKIKGNESPTEKQVEKFCTLFNECVTNGDIFYGTLCKPAYMIYNHLCEDVNEKCIMLFCYPLCKISEKELFAKYPFFVPEGTLPTYVID